MGSGKFLDSVLSIMPAVQARQISELLADLQVQGQVRDAHEYTTKLQELAVLINADVPRPSFQQIRSIAWHLCSSDAHNIMMQALKNDIEAIFLQTDEIGQRVGDHHSLVLQNLFRDLEKNLNEQEHTIRKLEWLANQNNEFSLALVNSFSSSSLLRIPRSAAGAENLYFDNRTYLKKNEVELPSATVDIYAKKLMLATSNEPQLLPVSARLLTDQYSYGTELVVEVDNPIENIIDGTAGTYWTRHVHLQQPVPKVTTVLDLDLGVGKDINYVIIEGATAKPFFIEAIEAVAPDGYRVTLLGTSTEISGRTRIDFNRCLARSIKITFAVYSYDRGEYYIDPTSVLHDAFEDDNTMDEMDLIAGMGPLIQEVLNNDELSDICNVPDAPVQQISNYVYSFGLDNIWFGNSQYKDTGIFVSESLNTDNIGVIAVDATEKSESGTVHNSVEYEIIKRDTAPALVEARFPVPKLGQTTVTSERLILTKREDDSVLNDVGILRFCPYVDPSYDTLIDLPPVYVYRNGEPLSCGPDFLMAVAIKTLASNEVVFDWKDNFADAATFGNYNITPQKMVIKIINPASNDIYTVSYTIRTSDTYTNDNTVWLDPHKKIFLSDEGRAYVRRDNPDMDITSKIYLQVTLRRNVAEQSSTPELHEYAVLGATYT
jgi:hypothetical protein